MTPGIVRIAKEPRSLIRRRKVGEDSPYRRLAQIQIATDEARLEKNDDAIHDLKALTESDPNDLQLWSALGDAYRAANKFPEAAGAYDKAIALIGAPQQKKDWILYFSRAASRDRAASEGREALSGFPGPKGMYSAALTPRTSRATAASPIA